MCFDALGAKCAVRCCCVVVVDARRQHATTIVVLRAVGGCVLLLCFEQKKQVQNVYTWYRVISYDLIRVRAK